MKLNLGENIISPADLRSLIEEVEAYAAYSRHRHIQARAGARPTKNTPRISETANEFLAANKPKDGYKLRDLDRLIAELEQRYHKSPQARITLADIASTGLKLSISNWLRLNVNESVLIDFRSDSTILGGMIVVVGSHIYDWSMRRQLLETKNKLIDLVSNNV